MGKMIVERNQRKNEAQLPIFPKIDFAGNSFEHSALNLHNVDTHNPCYAQTQVLMKIHEKK